MLPLSDGPLCAGTGDSSSVSGAQTGSLGVSNASLVMHTSCLEMWICKLWFRGSRAGPQGKALLLDPSHVLPVGRIESTKLYTLSDSSFPALGLLRATALLAPWREACSQPRQV